MKKQRSDSLKSQEYIKDALSGLLKEKPYNHITVTELCKRAGVARITFYKYYNTPDDVFGNLVQRTMDKYLQAVMKANVTDNYERMLVIWFSCLMPYAASLKNMIYSNKTYLIYEVFRESFIKIFPLNYQDKELETIKYTGYTGGLFIIVMEWVRGGMKESPEKLAKMVSQTLTF